jgi:hypothetical protein
MLILISSRSLVFQQYCYMDIDYIRSVGEYLQDEEQVSEKPYTISTEQPWTT